MGPIFPELEPELENPPSPPPISNHPTEITDQDPPPPSLPLEASDDEDLQDEIFDPPSDSDSDETPPGDDEDDSHITLESMRENFRFVQMVREATLTTQFSPAELHSLENPRPLELSPSDDPDLLLSIKSFISTLDHTTSQEGYADIRDIILERYPKSGMLSYDRVKRRVSNLSGVHTWKHDMCIDSCAAFTGPFATLENCPQCGKSRYDPEILKKSDGKKKVYRKQCTTFPLGPQYQARWKDPRMAEKMFYRRDKTRELLEKRTKGEDYVYDDILCGSDYLDAVEDGAINDHDGVVMLSTDGAQLFQNKKSDCWIYIWIVLNLGPDERYKIRNIIIGGVIPGPKNPKHLDSFLFPGLAHVSALQKEGLYIWDGFNRARIRTAVFVLLVLMDAIAAADVSSAVDHHGKKGCRVFCGLAGRNKPGGPHYYPVLLRPLDFDNPTSDHADIDINNLPDAKPSTYQKELRNVMSSPTEAEYRVRRLDSGIRKHSIFGGLPRILPLPTCFPGDLMHQPVINLTSLMFELWCEKGNCRKGDDSGEAWDWAVLKGDVWKAHGQAVASSSSYFPRSFDRTPRNPAEKLSSGYKAWELLLYFYGLGPGLFYGILPEKYYKHYCKLVVGVRLMYQRELSPAQLQLAHQLLLEWVIEFECLYYRRKAERLHFVRQCVHSLVHLVPETLRIGPPSLSAQWTMERVIGIFGLLIKQPSNPFANLAEQAKKVAEVNALVSLWPSLERVKKDPRGSINIGLGYVLLGPKDTRPYLLSVAEKEAFNRFYSNLGLATRRSVYRWARLQIPNGQIARSFWKEVIRTSNGARTDCNVKVRDLILIYVYILT